MSTERITICVDADAARTYRLASAEDQRKLDLLLSLKIRDLASKGRPLADVMREVAQKARARGLTEDKLKAILDAE